MPQTIDYQLVLRDLRAKREKINAAIEAIEEMQEESNGKPSSGGVYGPAERPPGPAERSSTEDLNEMTTPEAVAAIIELAGEPLSPPQIARALERAGFKHKSGNFPNVVRSTMKRASKRFRQVGKKWTLVKEPSG